MQAGQQSIHNSETALGGCGEADLVHQGVPERVEQAGGAERLEHEVHEAAGARGDALEHDLVEAARHARRDGHQVQAGQDLPPGLIRVLRPAQS